MILRGTAHIWQRRWRFQRWWGVHRFIFEWTRWIMGCGAGVWLNWTRWLHMWTWAIVNLEGCWMEEDTSICYWLNETQKQKKVTAKWRTGRQINYVKMWMTRHCIRACVKLRVTERLYIAFLCWLFSLINIW